MVRSATSPVKKTTCKAASSQCKQTAAAAACPATSAGPIEIVFSFDTTSSMSGCIAEVRTKVQEVIERLFKDIPGMRIAVIAHGDYCDAQKYVTQCVDFTIDQKSLCDFVKNVEGTSALYT